MTDITYANWNPGQHVVLQQIWLGQLIDIRPVIVVRDDSQCTALYSHPGSKWASRRTVQRDASLNERLESMLRPLDGPWRLMPPNTFHFLSLTPHEQRHSVWLFWSSDWSLRRWYINIQAPCRRNIYGMIEQDQTLDLSVKPDKSCSWKDTDEFQELCRRGFYAPELAESIRSEAARMIRVIEANGSPFCDGWESWRPDPSWLAPELPPDWQLIGSTFSVP